MRNRAKYWVFEGIDGSGKGTQMKMLLERLYNNNIPYHDTVEPSTGPIGKFIRETILSGDYKTTELVRQTLFTADRFDHYYKEDGVKSKLNNGINVVSDRSYFSGLAYGGEVGRDVFNGLKKHVIVPDIIFFLDIDHETAFERISAARDKLEIYETKECLKKTRQNYIDAIGVLDGHLHHISIHDASKSVEDIHEEIWEVICRSIIL